MRSQASLLLCGFHTYISLSTNRALQVRNSWEIITLAARRPCNSTWVPRMIQVRVLRAGCIGVAIKQTVQLRSSYLLGLACVL